MADRLQAIGPASASECVEKGTNELSLVKDISIAFTLSNNVRRREGSVHKNKARAWTTSPSLTFRTDRDDEIVCGRAADVLQAMHLFRSGIGDPSGPKVVRVTIRGKLDTTLPNEHEFGMEMLVCRMRHLARQQRRFVYFHDLAGWQLTVKNGTGYCPSTRPLNEQLIERVSGRVKQRRLLRRIRLGICHRAAQGSQRRQQKRKITSCHRANRIAGVSSGVGPSDSEQPHVACSSGTVP